MKNSLNKVHICKTEDFWTMVGFDAKDFAKPVCFTL